MQDDAVTAQRELPVDRGDTLLWAAGRARRQPVLWDQLAACSNWSVVPTTSRPATPTDYRIGQKPL